MGCDAISIAPGVLFVFKAPVYEQEFLFDKQHRKRKSQSNLYSLDKVRDKLKWSEYHELAQDFWQTCLYFARLPTPSEYPRLSEVKERLGEPKKVLDYLLSMNEDDAFERAKDRKREDILVFIALNCFHQRRSLNSLPSALKKDIKALFGSYKVAKDAGERLLYQAGNKEDIAAIIEQTACEGLGVLNDRKYLIAQCMVDDLPALLRVYIGCTSLLYGEGVEADIIALKLYTTKIDLRTYKDFSQHIPVLLERVFIDLGRLKIDYVSYEDNPRIKRLFLKSKFMLPTDDGYDKQVQFDKTLTRYVEADRLHSDFSPEEIVQALPKSHKRKFEVALNRA